MSIVITLPRRSGQNSPITAAQWDNTMTTIEAAFLAVPSGTGDGSVTSVALTAPTDIFNVSGSPVTTSGTLALTLDTQLANRVWAGPTTGSPATPAFRALVAADLPTVPTSKGGTGLTGVGSADQLLKMDITGTNLEYATLSAGSSKVTVTLGSGSIVLDVDQSAMSLTSIGGTLSIAKGGTGATTAQNARLALLPSVTGNALKVLRVNAGATDYEVATISTGITTLNTLTSATQTFAVGTTGTDFGIVSSGSTHTFNMPSASSTNRGVVTTLAQTFNGQKTFNNAPILNSLDADTIPYLGSTKAFESTATFSFSKANECITVGQVKTTDIIEVSTATTLDETSYFVLTDSSSAAFQITLPSATVDLIGKEYHIQDYLGNATSRSVTVKTDGGGDSLNGVAGGSAVIGINYGYLKVKCVKTGQWLITGSKLT